MDWSCQPFSKETTIAPSNPKEFLSKCQKVRMRPGSNLIKNFARNYKPTNYVFEGEKMIYHEKYINIHHIFNLDIQYCKILFKQGLLNRGTGNQV